MASEKLDLSTFIVLALAGLLFFLWEKGGSGLGIAITGSTAGSGKGKGAGCGCTDAALGGATITPGGTATQAGLQPVSGTVNPGSGLVGRGTVRASHYTPPPSPGSVGAGATAGGGAQWQGRQRSTASGTTPGAAPSSPQNPTGSGIWVAHSTPARVRA